MFAVTNIFLPEFISLILLMGVFEFRFIVSLMCLIYNTLHSSI